MRRRRVEWREGEANGAASHLAGRMRQNAATMRVAARATLVDFALPWVRFESDYLRRSHANVGPSASGAASAASSSPVSTAPPKATDGSGQNAGAPSSR